jgi:hypothetical protein
MRLFIDSEDRTIVCFATNRDAARAVLKKLGLPASNQEDPVKAALNALGTRGAIINISQAFEAIEHSEDRAAQELAQQMKEAVNSFYKENGR